MHTATTTHACLPPLAGCYGPWKDYPDCGGRVAWLAAHWRDDPVYAQQVGGLVGWRGCSSSKHSWKGMQALMERGARCVGRLSPWGPGRGRLGQAGNVKNKSQAQLVPVCFKLAQFQTSRFSVCIPERVQFRERLGCSKRTFKRTRIAHASHTHRHAQTRTDAPENTHVFAM